MDETTTKPVRDEKFASNLAEARENGYDLVCAMCGSGINDDSDMHDMFCPLNPEIEQNRELAARWADRQKAKS